MAYATHTSVSTERSKGELERLLSRAGATGFVTGFEGAQAMVGFKIDGIFYSIRFSLPPQSDYAKTPAGRRTRSARDMLKHHEQACRSRWRAVVLIVKAKVEAVEIGLTTIEKVFATDLVLGNGKTVGEAVHDKIASGAIPKALPLLS